MMAGRRVEQQEAAEERGREEEDEERPKPHSLSRSDFGKLGCHFRTGMIYTRPSLGERGGGSRAPETCSNDRHVETQKGSADHFHDSTFNILRRENMFSIKKKGGKLNFFSGFTRPDSNAMMDG